MSLKGLIHREIGERLMEEALASAWGVSKHFARYFRIQIDFLRSSGLPQAEGLVELTEHTHPSSADLAKRR